MNTPKGEGFADILIDYGRRIRSLLDRIDHRHG
jgi:hypothetical protein